jgi:hypothetical protein
MTNWPIKTYTSIPYFYLKKIRFLKHSYRLAAIPVFIGFYISLFPTIIFAQTPCPNLLMDGVTDQAFCANTKSTPVLFASPASPPEEGKVLIIAADDQDWAAEVQAKLKATSTFLAVDVVDARFETPTLVQLQRYKAVLVYSSYSFFDSYTLGNNLAAYVDAGGGVVTATFVTASVPIGGNFNKPAYQVIVPGDFTTGFNQTLGTIWLPNHPLLRGVTQFSGGSSSYRGTSTTLTSGAYRVADWQDGLFLITAKDDVGPTLAKRVDLGFFPPSSTSRDDFWDANTDGATIISNALEYVSGEKSITYSWTNDNTAIGLAANGKGNLSSFTTINTTHLPIKATIRVKPTYAKGAITCEGAEKTFTITINPPPAVSISGLNTAYCKNADAVTLVGSPIGGSFTIDGVAATQFDPSLLNIGSHTVAYNFKNDISCSNSATQTVDIKALPLVSIIDLKTNHCKDETAISLIGNPVGGDFSIDNNSAKQLDPSVLTAGVHTVLYRFTDANSCTNTASQSVNIIHAKMDAVENQTLCANTTTTPVNFTPQSEEVKKCNVLIISADFMNCTSDVQAKLAETGAFTAVDVFDARNGTPSLYELKQYKAVLAFSNFGFFDANLLGDNLAAYIDGGGGVVSALFATGSIPIDGAFIGGAYKTPTYQVIVPASQLSGIPLTLGTVLLPNHPVMNGVSNFSGGAYSFRSTSTTLTPGGYRVADWSNGFYLITAKDNVGPANAKRVDLGFYPPSSDCSGGLWEANTDGTVLLKNALLYVSETKTISYNWTNDNTAIGLAASGTGNIPSFKALNMGKILSKATITVTPTYASGVLSCSGIPEKFSISVNPIPTITCPSGITVNNDKGKCGATVTYVAISTGTPEPIMTYELTGATKANGSGDASGSFFNLGVTTVKITVLNACETVSCSFTITVVDAEKPVFNCPTSFNVNNDAGICGAKVSFNITATDNCTPSLNITQTSGLATNAMYPLGETTNSFQTMDAVGNRATCTFSVTVMDAEKPIVQCKNKSLDFTLGGSVTYIPEDILLSVTDNCGSIKSFSLDRTRPFSAADVGINPLILTATDQKGNKGTCTAFIVVTRSELPQMSCPDSKIVYFEELNLDGSVARTSATTTAPMTSLTSADYLIDIPCNSSTSTPPASYFYGVPYDSTMASGADRIVVRYFSASYYGFPSSCSQVFYIKKPDITAIKQPVAATVVCENGTINTTPTSTGFPRFSNGSAISETTSGLTATYTDAPIVGNLLVRTWIIKDKCEIRSTFSQNITIVPCVVPQATISGAIQRETGDAVTATVKIYNQSDSNNLAQASFYKFPSLPLGQNYRIKPERNSDILNGVTTFDIAIISKYILGIEAAKSPYQLIAMDVNRNGEVDASDMLMIRNLVLRKTTSFPNNAAWRFIPRSYVFKNPENPFAEDFPEVINCTNLAQDRNDADFIAVKIGDANLTARANLNAIQTRNAPEIDYLELPDMVLEAGKEYRIPVKTHIKSLTALQFALAIDKKAVENFSIENGDLAQFGEGNYNVFSEKGIVTTAWASAKATTDNTIFTLIVKAKKQVNIRDLASLNSAILDNLAYNTEGGEKQLQLHFAGETTAKPQSRLPLDVPFELYQNRPNPFRDETVISFILPETNMAELTIFDINGKKIYSLNKGFSKGYNEVIFNKTILQSTGVYFYRLQSDKFVAVKRMQYFAD